MIKNIPRLKCKDTYLDEVDLHNMSRKDIDSICLLDMKAPRNLSTGIAYRLLSIDIWRGGVFKLWCSSTGRYRTNFDRKRYLIISQETIIDIQNDMYKSAMRQVLIRWDINIPQKYVNQITMVNKDLHDF